MNTWYWVKEYILVFIAYGVVMFVWPEIVFRKWLKGRSLTMRICFDSMFMIAATDLFVLGLGLAYILNQWVVRIVFWGVLAASLIIPFVKENGRYSLKRFGALLTGGYGIKSLWHNARKGFKKKVVNGKEQVNGRLNNHVFLYAALLVVFVYGMIYFDAGVFETHSYGFGDMYTHHRWVYELTNGNVFNRGVFENNQCIYPEGMHAIVYLIHTCFGISIYSVMLFLQPIHVGLFLLSIFILCKEVFNWRYMGGIVLTIFLTVGYGIINTIYAFSRLQWTLPQEFGAVAAILCPVFLLRYLKEVKNEDKEKPVKKIYQDENLIIFGLSLFVTIAVHFYCTILAFFLCLAVVLPYFKQVFAKKHFGRLLITVIVFTLLAVAPMLIALAEGMRFQGSIGWAMSVINGTEKNSGVHITTPTPTPTPTPTAEPGENGNVEVAKETFTEALQRIGKSIVNNNFGNNFTKDIIAFYLKATAVSVIAVILSGIVLGIIVHARRKKEKTPLELPGIASLIALLLMYVNVMLLCYPGSLSYGSIKLPQLISDARLNYYASLFNIMVIFIPLDIFVGILNVKLKGRGSGPIAIAVMAASLVAVVYTGNYHGKLYFELTRYNSAVDTTVKIMQENDRNTYTIVSTVDETWQVVQNGRHEELITFLNGATSDSYSIPTKMVYIFVEKHPIHYAQRYFPQLPGWLAQEGKSEAVYRGFAEISTGQENIVRSELKTELGIVDMINLPTSARTYTNSVRRVTVESRALSWINEFEKYYPRTIKVYYEDENFVCYCFEQNTNSTYELAIQHGYTSVYILDEETGDIIQRITDNKTGEIVSEEVVGKASGY